MAPIEKAQIVTSLFILMISGSNSLRYGQKSNSLHILSISEDAYMGQGVRTLVAEQETQSDLPLRRFRRSLHKADSSNITHEVQMNDSHYQMIIHWAGAGSDAIVILTRDVVPDANSTSRVYVSKDYGLTFSTLSLEVPYQNRKATIDRYFNSPLYNSHYVFTDIINNLIFTTTNFGDTLHSYRVNFTPRQISMHAKDVNIILSYDPEDPRKRLWLTENFGETWRVIQEGVKSFYWGTTQYDQYHTLYVERQHLTGDHVIQSHDLFRTSHVMKSGIVDFQLLDDYMFVSQPVNWPNKDHLELWISYKRQPFQKAIFPYDDVHKDYYIADASEEQVFVCVYHNESTTHLYISDPAGTQFTLSLRKVVYFNPDFRNNTVLGKVHDKPFADIYKIEAIPGFYIASQFTNDSFSLDTQASMITFDKGSSWEYIRAPSVDAEGNRTGCSPFSFDWFTHSFKRCSLHLAQNFHLYHPRARTSPILSKKSAVGIVMATGSLGTNMDTNMNVYISNDGGIRWHEAFKGTYFYTFGDHGGIIVAVRQMSLARELFYSTNEGETWHSLQFSNNSVIVYGLLSEPGEKTTKFSIFASYPTRHEWVVFQVDLKHTLGTACRNDDYKQWSPTESYKVDCLLGQKVIFERRRAHSQCFNGLNYDREISVQNCTCTQLDYECDLGFTRRSPWSHLCVRDNNSTIDTNQVPSPCPEGTYYNRTKGYRRISGDKCQGGVESRFEPDMILCPMREQDEFILYTTQTTVHKRSFTSSRDELIPVHGLTQIVAVEFDYQQNCVYFADLRQDTIEKICLNQSSMRTQETIIGERLGAVESLALDWMSATLFWVDAEHKRIEMARTDGTRRRVLIDNTTVDERGRNISIDRPRALVVYPKYGYMYWSDWSDNKPAIMFAWMDGTHIRTLVSGARVAWPNGLAIDEQHERLYWTDARKHGIYSVDLNGRSYQVLLQNMVTLPHPYAISVYKDNIYWTDWNLGAILVTNKYTANYTRRYVQNVHGIMDLKIFHFASQQGSSPCSHGNGGCSSICTERPHNATTPFPINRTCLCSDAFVTHIKSVSGEQCLCATGEAPNPSGDGCVTSNGTTCSPTQLLCRNSKCIPSTWRCDRDHDCGPDDDTDERDCSYDTCAPGMFTCANNRCIPMSWKCDHDHDCGPDDPSDEPANCHYPSCGVGEFQCHNRKCINHSWVCDGDDDCRDGSDENATYCQQNTTAPSSCSPGQFLCANGRCIPGPYQCDGADDCDDNSDELQCNATASTCSTVWEFQCPNGKCIYHLWVCDGEDDCDGGADESQCGTTPASTTPVPSCNSHYSSFHCDNSSCVPLRMVCDGVEDCWNGDDEWDCGQTTTRRPFITTTTNPSSCSGTNEYLCRDGQCIFESWLCDGTADCHDGEDELKCDSKNKTICPGGYFKCFMSAGCLPPSWVCDGEADCADHSDEQSCGSHSYTTPSPCGESQFTCGSGQCVPKSMVCDGHWDCYDNSDESSDCAFMVSRLSVDHIGGQQVDVHWSGVTVVTPYKVTIMYRERGSTSWDKEITVGKNNNTLTLTNLHYGTWYEVTVVTVTGTKNYTSPQTLAFTTNSGRPDKPKSVRLSVTSEDKETGKPTLHVQWQEPDTTNGPVTRYTVYISKDNNPALQKDVQVNSAESKSNYELQFTEFFEGDSLQVTVSAFTTKEGEPSTSQSVQMIVPGLPHCISTTQTDLTVTEYLKGTQFNWSYTGDAKTDKIDKFRITLIPKYTLEVKQQFELTITQVKFDNGTYSSQVKGWSPGLEYIGYIQAHNASGYGFMCKGLEVRIVTKGTALEAPKLDISQDKTTFDVTVKVKLPSKPADFTDKWNPQVNIYYTENGEALLSPDKMTTDIKKVTVTSGSSAVISNRDISSCTTYVFRSEISDPLVTPLAPAITFATSYNPKSPITQFTLNITSKDERYATFNVSLYSHCTWRTMNPKGYILTSQEQFENGTVRGGPKQYKVPVINRWLPAVYSLKLKRGAYYKLTARSDIPGSYESKPIIQQISPHRAPRDLELLPEFQDLSLHLRWQIPKDPPKSYSYGIYHAVNNDNYTLVSKEAMTEVSIPFVNLATSGLHKFKVRLEDVYGYPGVFSTVETFETPSADKWSSLINKSSAAPPTSVNVLAAALVPCVVIVVILASLLGVYVMRHRRLQRSLLTYASSHYDTRSGLARLSTSDDLDEEEQPMIQGFSDDEPLIVA